MAVPTAPRGPIIARTDFEAGSEVVEDRRRQALGEDIRAPRAYWTCMTRTSSRKTPAADEVEVDFNMFGVLVRDRVAREIHRCYLAVEDDNLAHCMGHQSLVESCATRGPHS